MGKKKCIGRCSKAPLRFLIKARDFYLRTMCNWAARLEKCSGGAAGCYAAAPFSIHPNSYSFHSSANSAHKEEQAELLRAASARHLSKRVGDDQSKILRRPPCVVPPVAGGGCGAGRKGRFVIERIEEEMSCEFGEDSTVETPGG